MFKLISDTLTPNIDKVSRRLGTEPAKFMTRMLKFAKGKAKLYARGSGGNNRTGDLVRGIGYRVYKKSGRGILFSFAAGNSGKMSNYALWVNKDIPISSGKETKYFAANQGLIYYGQNGAKSPSGKNIHWNIGAKMGFFTQALIDTERVFKKQQSQLIERILI